jgi:preprotein translocase subunit YajC
MFSYLHVLIADTAPEGGSTPAPEQGAWWTTFLPLPLLLLLFYFLMIRPGQRQAQERQQFFTNIKKNDKVLTSSGIIGNFVSLSENEAEAIIKLDDNTRVRMTKESIVRNLSQEEAAKEQKEPPKEQPKA